MYKNKYDDIDNNRCTSSYFTHDSALGFPDAAPWMYPIFNFLPLNFFTVDNLSLSQTSPSSSITLHQRLPQSSMKHETLLDLQVDTSIINPHHFIPKPQIFSSNNFYRLVWHII